MFSAIFISLFVAGFSIPGVWMPLEAFKDSSWHTKTSYIALAVGIPLQVVLMLLLNRDNNDEDSDDEDQELSTLGRQSETETVAIADDETISDLPSIT